MGVSIIMPVYNAEKYLRTSIDSVLAQTYSDWELILVDDGSGDTSGEICESYAQKDKRIRYIRQENGGPAKAVHTGLCNAGMPWIMFLDADDWYDAKAVEAAVSLVEEDQSDCAETGYRKVREDGSVIDTPLILTRSVMTRDEILSKVLIPFYEKDANIYKYWSSARWNKIFRRDLLLKTYDDISEMTRIGEDLEMNLGYLHYAQKISVGEGIYYNYRVLEKSLAHGYDPDLDVRVSALTETIADLAERQGYTFKARDVMEDDRTSGLIYDLLETKNLPLNEKRKIAYKLISRFHDRRKILKLLVYLPFPGKTFLQKLYRKIRG